MFLLKSLNERRAPVSNTIVFNTTYSHKLYYSICYKSDYILLLRFHHGDSHDNSKYERKL